VSAFQSSERKSQVLYIVTTGLQRVYENYVLHTFKDYRHLPSEYLPIHKNIHQKIFRISISKTASESHLHTRRRENLKSHAL
jgi:hypothetical protein